MDSSNQQRCVEGLATRYCDKGSTANKRIIDGQPEAYFRGRKLKGKESRIPTGYKGVVVKDNTNTRSEDGSTESMIAQDYEPETDGGKTALITMDNVAEYSEVVIWGHETVAEQDNVFVKSVDEWVALAEAVSKPYPLKQ